MKSKILTIVFVDVQGYTSRTATQTREQNQLFVKEITDFIRKHTEDKNGNLVKTMGDGFLLTFESPTDAVNCGIAMQKEIEKRNANVLNEANFVKLRIGVSTGEVSLNENNDVFGDAVNIASRIEKFAEAGSVFISESTYLAMNKAEVKAIDLGPQKFKNVLQEVRVFKVLKNIDETSLKTAKPDQTVFLKAALIVLAIFILLALAANLFRKKEDLAKYKQAQQVERDPFTPSRQFRNKQRLQELSSQELQKMTEKAEASLKINPNDFKALMILGYAAAKDADFSKAQEYFSRAIKVDPAKPQAHYALATLYERQGFYGKAIASLEKYISYETRPMLIKRTREKIEKLKSSQN